MDQVVTRRNFYEFLFSLKKNIIKKQVRPTLIDFWLGYLGSNQEMSDSESDALPFGYTPIIKYHFRPF